MPDEKKTEFPKKFDKCPICGCEETVVQKAIKDETVVVPVNMTKKDLAFAAAVGLPTALVVVMVAVAYDVCWDCGCLYAKSVNIMKVAQGVGPVLGQPGMGGQFQ